MGVAFALLGRHTIKEPDSDWARWLSRIPEDVEQTDVDLLRMQRGGILSIGFGILLFLIGISEVVHLFAFGFMAAVILIAIGISLIRYRQSWLYKNLGDGGDQYMRIKYFKFAGTVLLALGTLVMVLCFQFL